MAQMFDHTLDGIKGWPSPYAVDFVAALDSGVTTADAGSLVSLNASGDFVLGLSAAGAMPMWIFQNHDDPDVANDGGDTATDANAWVPVAPTGQIMALVAVGAYHLETTEYEGTITYNTRLKAGTTAGKVEDAAPTDDCVGVASGPPAANSHGIMAVQFWPVYDPV